VDSSKLKGLDSTDAWLGTVKTGAINGGLTPVDISGLGNANSSVEADSISGQSMTAGTVGTVDVLGDVSLTNGDSTVNDMTVEGNLSLGATADSSLTAGALTVNGETGIALQNGSTVDADTLTVTNGGIDLSEGSAVTADEALTVGAGITLGKDAQVKAGELKVGSLSLEEGSSVGADTLTVEGSIEYKSLAADAPITVGDMTNDTLDLTVDTELLKDAVDAGQDVTFIHVANGSEAEISLNGGSNILKNHGEKYSYTVDWDEAGQNVTLDAIANENYMKEKFEGAEPNAIAGATLMDEAFASDGIGAGGDLEKLLASVDNGSMTEEGMAAVAGASTASLGMAFAGDVERQLRAIRNRTTTMGVNQCVVNEGMPYFNAWVNAEGNFGELDQDGLASGYQLDSWGGTVGFDVDVNPNLTLGLAVTAMYGDLTVDGPDMLEGDLDTYYVTAFARYSKRAWTHTFIGTIGMMDGSYERTVNYAGGSYKTEGDTDGMAFGLMYEVGRVYAL
ncbi:MAG: autotransporter domain-containing protein, partial [Akkermansia sp.]|nr:autotransporter domain-containing protein [Akkermansia sp.]